MASLTKLIWSLLRRICTSDNGHYPSTSSSAPTTRRVGGPFTTAFPCNPETGVGLLVVVAKPASSYLRTGIHGVMTVAADLCCNRACSSVHYCGTLEANTSRINKSCRLCSYRLDGARVYTYMGTMFCTRGYRFDYFMDALYYKRHNRELTCMLAGNRISAAVKEWLVSTEEEHLRKIFFSR